MNYQELNIELTLLSDACPGTGIGTDLVDNHIPRDENGQPWIPASHLKGLLRQKLMDTGRYRKFQNSDLVDGIFGSPGTSDGEKENDGTESVATVSNLRINSDTKDTNSRLITKTALNQWGTAKDTSLRTQESLAVGTKLTGKIILRADKGSWQDTALRLSLLSLDAVGGSRNRGAGWCKVTIKGEKRSPGAFLNLLFQDTTEIKLPEKPQPTRKFEPKTTNTTWLELTFHASAPICCPTSPVSSANNVIRSGFVIPASAVQGAVLTALNRNHPAMADACFASDSFRCWPLQPAGIDLSESEGLFPIRTPSSQLISKLANLQGNYDFYDSAVQPFRWSEIENQPIHGGDGVLLKSERSVTSWSSYDMPRQWFAHGVRNGPMDKDGDTRNLFQVEAMAPMVFKGLLACPEDCREEILKAVDGKFISLGRSRSVRGGGKLKVRVLGAGLGEFSKWKLPNGMDRRVFVLQSPAAVSDNIQEFGAVQDRLKELVGKEICETICIGDKTAPGIYADADVLFGWNRHGKGKKANRKHNRLRAKRVIKPGSVFVLKEAISEDEFTEFLLKGIGDGKDQGFGSILPHPGIACSKFGDARDKIPTIAKGSRSAREALKLYRNAENVSPSQIGSLASKIEPNSCQRAKEFFEKQLRGRTEAIWDRWKGVEEDVKNVLTDPGLAKEVLAVWQDLAVANKNTNIKDR